MASHWGSLAKLLYVGLPFKREEHMTLHTTSDSKREKNANKLQNNSLPFINRKRALAVFCAADILTYAIIMQHN